MAATSHCPWYMLWLIFSFWFFVIFIYSGNIRKRNGASCEGYGLWGRLPRPSGQTTLQQIQSQGKLFSSDLCNRYKRGKNFTSVPHSFTPYNTKCYPNVQKIIAVAPNGQSEKWPHPLSYLVLSLAKCPLS